MVLQGYITDGIGVAKIWVEKIKKIFKGKTGINIFQGTLNVKIDVDYVITPDFIIEPEEYGGTQRVFVKKCKIFGTDAYIVRAEKNQTGKGDHDLRLLEIVSNINFRETYNLTNGEKVEIEIE